MLRRPAELQMMLLFQIARSLRWCAAMTLLWVTALAGAGVRADGFVLSPLSLNSSLKNYPLTLELKAGQFSPVFNYGSFLTLTDAASTYYIASGLGVPKLNIEDTPGAAAWAVVPDTTCATLRNIPVSDVKRPDVKPITVREAPLPFGCAASFQGTCTSKDNRLTINTRFDGTHRIKKVGGGFYGTEGKIDAHFYTGQRTLSIEHIESGKKIEFVERLNDTPAFATAERQIAYLPKLSLILLIGLAKERGVPVAGCIKLP
jgi:hypothetical protein